MIKVVLADVPLPNQPSLQHMYGCRDSLQTRMLQAVCLELAQMSRRSICKPVPKRQGLKPEGPVAGGCFRFKNIYNYQSSQEMAVST